MSRQTDDPTPKDIFDVAFAEMTAANDAYKAVIDEGTSYKTRVNEARIELLAKKVALDTAQKELKRATTFSLSGRPPGRANNEPDETAKPPAGKRKLSKGKK